MHLVDADLLIKKHKGCTYKGECMARLEECDKCDDAAVYLYSIKDMEEPSIEEVEEWLEQKKKERSKDVLHYSIGNIFKTDIKDCYDFVRYLNSVASRTWSLTIEGYRFDNINFVGVNLSDILFCHCIFTQCKFINCTFNGTVFSHCEFCPGPSSGRVVEDCMCLFYNNGLPNDVSKCPISIDFNFCEMNNVIFRSNRDNLVDHIYISNCDTPNWYLWNEFPSHSYIPSHCPEEGEFIGWKAAYTEPAKNLCTKVIVKLFIPTLAKRSNAPLTSNDIYSSIKCRCSEAWVLAVYDVDGNRLDDDTLIRSEFDPDFTYKVGDNIKCKEPFEENRFLECASGIHFFMNRQDACNYYLIPNLLNF